MSATDSFGSLSREPTGMSDRVTEGTEQVGQDHPASALVAAKTHTRWQASQQAVNCPVVV